MRRVLRALFSVERASLEEEGGSGRYEKGSDDSRSVRTEGGRSGRKAEWVRTAGGGSGRKVKGGSDGRRRMVGREVQGLDGR